MAAKSSKYAACVAQIPLEEVEVALSIIICIISVSGSQVLCMSRTAHAHRWRRLLRHRLNNFPEIYTAAARQAAAAIPRVIHSSTITRIHTSSNTIRIRIINSTNTNISNSNFAASALP